MRIAQSIVFILVIIAITIWAMADSIKRDKKVDEIYQQCDWVYTVEGEPVCRM